MYQSIPGCVILADRHLELAGGVLTLLESAFATVYVVADISSLLEGAKQLSPAMVTLDLSLTEGNIAEVLKRLREIAPDCRVVVLSVHDQEAASHQSLEAGAHGIVLKRTIGSDFLPAVNAVMRGERFVSAGFGAPGPGPTGTRNAHSTPGSGAQ